MSSSELEKSSGSVSEESLSSDLLSSGPVSSSSGFSLPDDLGSSSSIASSSFGSSSGLVCDWHIGSVTYVADDAYDIEVINDSPDDLTITNIFITVPGTPVITPSLWFTIPGNSSQVFSLDNDGSDLRNSGFTVHTELCGHQDGTLVFP